MSCVDNNKCVTPAYLSIQQKKYFEALPEEMIKKILEILADVGGFKALGCLACTGRTMYNRVHAHFPSFREQTLFNHNMRTLNTYKKKVPTRLIWSTEEKTELVKQPKIVGRGRKGELIFTRDLQGSHLVVVDPRSGKLFSLATNTNQNITGFFYAVYEFADDESRSFIAVYSEGVLCFKLREQQLVILKAFQPFPMTGELRSRFVQIEGKRALLKLDLTDYIYDLDTLDFTEEGVEEFPMQEATVNYRQLWKGEDLHTVEWSALIIHDGPQMEWEIGKVGSYCANRKWVIFRAISLSAKITIYATSANTESYKWVLSKEELKRKQILPGNLLVDLKGDFAALVLKPEIVSAPRLLILHLPTKTVLLNKKLTEFAGINKYAVMGAYLEERGEQLIVSLLCREITGVGTATFSYYEVPPFKPLFEKEGGSELVDEDSVGEAYAAFITSPPTKWPTLGKTLVVSGALFALISATSLVALLATQHPLTISLVLPGSVGLLGVTQALFGAIIWGKGRPKTRLVLITT